MRTEFFGHYPPDEPEFARLWNDATFVFDTNVLLDVYRYSEDTANQIVSTLEKLKQRIWIPYQVAHEYHRHLDAVIRAQVSSYAECIGKIEGIIAQLDTPRSHPFVGESSVDALKLATEELKREKVARETLFIRHPRKDQIADHLSGCIGPQFSVEELQAIYTEGEGRYRQKIPPGYKDQGKSTGPERYGDLVIWKSILQHAKLASADIIFVTNDSKEDWYEVHLGQTLGPRKELVTEFHTTLRKRFHAYPVSKFLVYAQKLLSFPITDDALQEVRTLPIAMPEKLMDIKGLDPTEDVVKADASPKAVAPPKAERPPSEDCDGESEQDRPKPGNAPQNQEKETRESDEPHPPGDG